MSHYLKVTSRGSISARALVNPAKPGTKFSKEECERLFGGPQEVDRLVDQGYLRRLHEDNDPDERPLPPQTTNTPPIPSMVERDEPAVVTAGRGEAKSNAKVAKAAKARAVATDAGPWNLDPSKLGGKDIHELNVMVVERSPTEIAPFETVEEAVAWLSQDFDPGIAVATS